VRIRIEATELPGRTFTPGPGHPCCDNVHVGVQRRGRPDELLDPHPGDAASAAWTLDCATAATAEGIDITGRYVQGRPGDRFVYLSWGTVGDDGVFTMFRRAKLMLGAIDPDVVGAAARSGRLLARVRLTDPKGGPLCARVRPPYVEWSAGQAR
jgi:hypothetical protein